MNKKVMSEQRQNTFSFLRAKNNFRNISLSNVLSLIVLHSFVKNSPPAEKDRSASTKVGGIIMLLHTTE